MFWTRKKVLVTGADGFVGSHLCEALRDAGASVRALVRAGNPKNLRAQDGIFPVKGDVLDFDSLLEASSKVDVVYHLGAITLIPETRSMMANTFSTNSVGTLNLLMAALRNNVSRFIYVSTCHVYGEQASFPIRETAAPKPIDIYSASKLAGEHLCTSFVKMFDLDVVITRAFNHFGPRQRTEFLIPSIITKLIGGTCELGDPEPTRDFSYVDDIVSGYLAVAELGRTGEIYQFCSGVERTVRDIATEIVRIGKFNADLKWHPGARKVDLPRSYGTYEKAKAELGWRPKTTFEEGISRTIEWYKKRTLGGS